MLVDDEKVIRDVLTGELSDRGFEVIEAENGAAALALLETGATVELIVTDLAMPGIDGVALIHAAQERNRRLPAILLTGYAGDTRDLDHRPENQRSRDHAPQADQRRATGRSCRVDAGGGGPILADVAIS